MLMKNLVACSLNLCLRSAGGLYGVENTFNIYRNINYLFVSKSYPTALLIFFKQLNKILSMLLITLVVVKSGQSPRIYKQYYNLQHCIQCIVLNV